MACKTVVLASKKIFLEFNLHLISVTWVPITVAWDSTFLGFRWSSWPPDMEGGCVYIE
jgi:hypothetical protein